MILQESGPRKLVQFGLGAPDNLHILRKTALIRGQHPDIGVLGSVTRAETRTEKLRALAVVVAFGAGTTHFGALPLEATLGMLEVLQPLWRYAMGRDNFQKV